MNSTYKIISMVQSFIILILIGYIYFNSHHKESSQQTFTSTNTTLSQEPNTYKKNQVEPQEAQLLETKDSIKIDPLHDSKIQNENINDALTKLVNSINPSEASDLIKSYGDNIIKMASSDLNFAKSILEQYPYISNPQVEDLLAQSIAMSNLTGLEDIAIKNINESNGIDNKKWYRLLSYDGAKSEESRDLVLDNMHSLDDERLKLAINSLSPEGAYSQEKQKIVTELKNHSKHHNPEIRASSIEALGYWSEKNDANFIVESLDDESSHVRSAALNTIHQSGIKSDALKSRLINMMDNKENSAAERLDSSSALMRYKLTDEEQEQLNNFLANKDHLEQQLDSEINIMNQ